MQATVRFSDARDEKLSAKAYLQEALRNGRTTVDKVRKVEKLLSHEGAVHPWIDRFVGNAFEQMVATRVDRGAMLRPAMANLHMVLGASIDQFVYLLTETLMYGTTPLELMALAALRAIEAQPDAFGVIDDFDAHMAAGEENYRAFRAACTRILDTAKMEDMHLVPFNAGESLYKLTFKWNGTDTGIGIGSPEAAAQLVAKVASS